MRRQFPPSIPLAFLCALLLTIPLYVVTYRWSTTSPTEVIESRPRVELQKPANPAPKQQPLLSSDRTLRETSHITRISDTTLEWDDSVNRLWQSMERSSKIGKLPPAKLHLTRVGFNHPNQTFGLSLMRTIRTKELLEGVVNHPWFDPVNEIEDDSSASTRHYFFFDKETCKEKNYPLYGKGAIHVNQDPRGGRITHRPKDFSYRVALEDALRSISTKKNAYMVVFECGGKGPKPPALQRDGRHPQLILASLSAIPSQLILPLDQGLPPPAIVQVTLTALEKGAINDVACSSGITNDRPILVSFMGNYRHEVRRHLRTLFHNGKDVILAVPATYRKEIQNASVTSSDAYQHLLRQSRFGFVLHGDNRFSYRFAEVLSAGAIPVVLADDWVLPFSPALVKWEQCLLRIPEARVKDALDIIRNVTNEQECHMRKKAYEVYETYLKTARGTIDGIVTGIEGYLSSTNSAWRLRKKATG
jgi:hypothetical protein